MGPILRPLHLQLQRWRCTWLKVYLHNPTDGVWCTSQHNKNRINPIFVVLYDI
jgi:hypothetical protein